MRLIQQNVFLPATEVKTSTPIESVPFGKKKKNENVLPNDMFVDNYMTKIL